MIDHRYAIIGDKDASPKLVKAALTDQLEMHDLRSETMSLAVAIPKPAPAIYEVITDWAKEQEINLLVYSQETDARFLRNAVDSLAPSDTVYALLGDEDPSTQVRRAIANAIDRGIEVRDLAEAGLTYVGLADEAQTKENIGMAEEEVMTLEQAGEAADQGDEEALEALDGLAKEAGLDPDDYETWLDLAVAIEALEEDETGDGAAPPEEDETTAPEADAEVTSTESFTADELGEMDIKDLRHLARQLGVADYDKLRTPGLIKGILAIQGGEEAAEPVVSKSGSGSLSEHRSAPDDFNIGAPSVAQWARAFRAFADALEA